MWLTVYHNILLKVAPGMIRLGIRKLWFVALKRDVWSEVMPTSVDLIYVLGDIETHWYMGSDLQIRYEPIHVYRLTRRQTITWTNDDLLPIVPIGTDSSEIWITIIKFSIKKMWLKMSFAKWRPFCPGVGVGWGLEGELTHPSSYRTY